jgi:hypothetical protein
LKARRRLRASKSSRVIKIGPGYEDPGPSREHRGDPKQAEQGVLETEVSEIIR